MRRELNELDTENRDCFLEVQLSPVSATRGNGKVCWGSGLRLPFYSSLIHSRLVSWTTRLGYCPCISVVFVRFNRERQRRAVYASFRPIVTRLCHFAWRQVREWMQLGQLPSSLTSSSAVPSGGLASHLK